MDPNKLWTTLKEMGIPDHLIYLLRNMYAGQETTVRTGHGTTDWFQIGKGVRQICILSPCLFNFYACKMPGWVKHKLEPRLPGEISITSDMQMIPLLWQKVKSENVALKLNIQKTKIMASSPITLQQIDGEIMETVRDFILGGSKITADDDCSCEMKRHLLLGRKAMTNLDST